MTGLYHDDHGVETGVLTSVSRIEIRLIGLHEGTGYF
jgi:hypothetical protein